MPTANREPVLLVDREEGVVTLTLNRPAAMNALSRELRRALAAAFRDVAEDAAVGAVIVTGNGRAFCAGLDLKELGGEAGDGSPGALLDETDMLSCDRATLLAVKRVYDEGYQTTLGEGLRIEGRTSIEHARAVRPEHVASRRRDVQQRGRSQSR